MKTQPRRLLLLIVFPCAMLALLCGFPAKSGAETIPKWTPPQL